MVSVFLAAGWLGGQAVHAATSPPATLYVDQSFGGCSDSGPGTQSEPFCTVQAAADVVTAGQTVAIEAGTHPGYAEAVSVKNSGTSSAPITFTAVRQPGTPVAYLEPASGAPVTLDHVHDVILSGLDLFPAGNADGADVVGSQNVTLDRLSISRQGSATATPNGVTIDGGSSTVTVSRSSITEAYGYGVRAEPGAQQITIAADYVLSPYLYLSSGVSLGGISVSGVTGAAVTGNSVRAYCGPALTIDGGSSATVENNFLGAAPPPTACTTPGAALAVSADSTAGVHSDYNALIAGSPRPEYSWGGTAYSSAAAYTTGTGQGTHDMDAAIWPTGSPPPEGSPLIDSADCSAPGELASDLPGNPRVDDPLVTDEGSGTCHADRGAVERQDGIGGLAYSTSPSPAQGPAPLDLSVTITPGATSSWGEPTSYQVDFGDGSAPATVAAAGGTASHTYTTPGRYVLTVAAADTGGSRLIRSQAVVVGTAAPPQASLTAGPYLASSSSGPSIAPDTGYFSLARTPDDWEVASWTVSLGDGFSEPVNPGYWFAYEYPRAGTYTATLTETDLLGRTSAAHATVTVGDEFWPVGPVRDYAAKVGAHQLVKLSMPALHAASSGTHVAQLRVMAGSPGGGGSVIVYPDGTTRPAVGSVDFARGKPASNLVWARPGSYQQVDFYNNSGASIYLRVCTTGIEGGVAYGDTYAPLSQAKVLDTRYGVGAPKGPVPAYGSRTVTVAGTHGVPVNAAAVALNVTALTGQATGYLTVYAHGTANPGTPDVAWPKGLARTGLVVVPLQDGKVVFRNASGGPVNVLAAVAGYYHLNGTGAVFLPLAKEATSAVIGPGQVLKMQVSGTAGIPGSGIPAAAVNLTASGATAAGYLAGYRDGEANPKLPLLHYSSGQKGAAAAIIPAGSDGVIDFYNGGSHSVTVRVDLTGFYYQYSGTP